MSLWVFPATPVSSHIPALCTGEQECLHYPSLSGGVSALWWKGIPTSVAAGIGSSHGDSDLESGRWTIILFLVFTHTLFFFFFVLY